MSSEHEQPEGAPQKDGLFLDQKLRPAVWKDYIGQEHIKQNLEILLSAARERKHPPEHLLFYGPPGLGKTTLSHIIALVQGGTIHVTAGPALTRVGDIASLLTNLPVTGYIKPLLKCIPAESPNNQTAFLF